MNLGWQDLAAFGLVAIAAVYLLRQAWRFVRRKPAANCGGCSHCPSASASGELVSLELPPRKPGRETTP